MHVSPGTIVVWSDIGCPWAHAAVARLHRARADAGLDGALAFDHRAFPLELANERPTPKRILDAEVPVVGGIEPEAGWRMWQGDASAYPVTTLLALEAVQAAKEQGLEAGAQLDRALRRAFFAESRCISLLPVVVAVAAGCPAVDAGALVAALRAGRGRGAVLDQWDEARNGPVQGSPHLFLPDGTDVANPGVRMRWVGEEGVGFPVVDADDPSVYAELVRSAARQRA